MKVIDLSMTVQRHWRWNIQPSLAMDHAKGDSCQSTIVNIPMHGFTHIDTPLHIEPGRIAMDQVPLDNFCGPASILDLTDKDAEQAITAEDVRQKHGYIQAGDIVILKTGWDLKRDYLSREYWLEAPYVSEEAADWLARQPIKAIGFDFPQDYTIREIPQRHPTPLEMPTHHLLLRKGIYLIEYLCNVHRITTERAMIFALPMKVKDAEGAPARVVAVVD